jgi:cytochrome c553
MRRLLLLGLCLTWLSACGPGEKVPSVAAVSFATVSTDKVEQGERIASVLGCTGCHAADLTGNDWSDPEFAAMWSSNLTVFVPTVSDAQLQKSITGGRRPDGSELWGMPSFLFTQLAPGDMTALLAFLRSKPPKGAARPRPVFFAAARKEMAEGFFKSSPAEVAEYGNISPPDMGAGHNLGRYIVRATCAECHQMNLRGGTPYPGAEPRPDIRIAASYDLKDFRRLLHSGVAPGERKLGLMGQVARNRYSHFTDAEIAAIHGYLKAVAAKDP